MSAQDGLAAGGKTWMSLAYLMPPAAAFALLMNAQDGLAAGGALCAFE